MKKILLVICFFCSQWAFGQFTQQDSLRGKLTPLRTCYDVTYYDLQLRVMPDEKAIKGSNTIHYKATEDFQMFQIDLFENMQIEKIVQNNKDLKFKRNGNATFVSFNKTQKKGTTGNIEVYYSGKPRPAAYAPWDGGFSWKKDKNGDTWIGVSCEGIGASLWWPNKDHLSDEPDSMRIRCEVPSDLICVANGNLRKEQKLKDGYTSYDWFVSYPINNYNVTLNIAKYTHFSDTYTSTDGESMSLDYYVLKDNLGRAKKQFEQVKPMLACYEKLFGKYPFWKDGFALVETPYLGMEHQGAIAYGNGYKNGYMGSDISGSGVGMSFDYIIIHESGHEYWGNSVSCQDHAEMWIHESWCTYTEVLYVECMFGKDKADKYVNGYKASVGNRQPIIAPLDVNASGSSDMYFKGALLLNTLRNVIDDDKLWFELVYDLSQEFKIKTTNTKEIVAFINKKAKQDFTYFFQQYLYYPALPVFEYSIKDDLLKYRWNADVKDFHMPIKVNMNGQEQLLKPTTEWQEMKVAQDTQLKVREDLYYLKVVKR